MDCPICSEDTRVLRTDGAERRRECTVCGHKFVTTEVLKDEHRRREQLLEDAKALAERLADAA